MKGAFTRYSSLILQVKDTDVLTTKRTKHSMYANRNTIELNVSSLNVGSI